MNKSLRKKGRLESWDDERGYGFISPFEGGHRVFTHIKAFDGRARRPTQGDVVTFTLSTDANGRPRAGEASIAGVPKARRPKQSGSWSTAMALGFLLIVTGAAMASVIPMLVLAFYLAVSIATYGAYALDKLAARKGTWRTSEESLHLLALIGGWPGAIIAQNRLRHKTRKQPFRAIFWLMVLLNCTVLIWSFTSEGTKVWQAVISAMV